MHYFGGVCVRVCARVCVCVCVWWLHDVDMLAPAKFRRLTRYGHKDIAGQTGRSTGNFLSINKLLTLIRPSVLIHVTL